VEVSFLSGQFDLKPVNDAFVVCRVWTLRHVSGLELNALPVNSLTAFGGATMGRCSTKFTREVSI
jgi:hypothetical protein